MLPFAYCPALTNLARLIHNRNTENLTWLGLGSGQLAVLRTIHEAPGIRQNAISEKLGLHKSVVSRAVKSLTRAGYLKKNIPQRGLWPTRQDLALRKCQENSYLEAEDRLTAGFSPEELSRFKEYLQRATAYLGRQPSAPNLPPFTLGGSPEFRDEILFMDF